jgi:aspartyl-tRNA(Asn)/glutamyl-tRNA(Gln) amidotransferase subunit A
MLVEALVYHRPMLAASPERYGRPFLARLRDGESISAADHAAALQQRRRIRAAVAALMRSYEVLALPTVPWPHRRIDDATPVAADRAVLTFLFNITGQPAISVPSGFTRDGLPLGLQLAARRFEEPVLLGAAAAYARAIGSDAWHPRVDVVMATRMSG